MDKLERFLKLTFIDISVDKIGTKVKYMIDLFVNALRFSNKRKYESYTRSAKQNQILKDTRVFNLDKIFYITQIQMAKNLRVY